MRLSNREEKGKTKYYDSTPCHGTLPMLTMEGYTADKYYREILVIDKYYNRHIKGKSLNYSSSWERRKRRL